MQPLIEPVVSNEKTISSGVGPSIGSGAGGGDGVTSDAVEFSRDSGAILFVFWFSYDSFFWWLAALVCFTAGLCCL